MSEQELNKDKNPRVEAFYIGWMAHAPGILVKHIRKVIAALVVVFVVAGALLAFNQKKFSTASFEFGKLTEIKGIYFNEPVPVIKIVSGKDIFGKISYTSIVLVGYGKHGAATAIKELEEEQHTSFNAKELTIKGTLLYSDGKTLLQVDKNDKPVIHVGDDAAIRLTKKDLGEQVINGEIIDPKCYFGVMKPGEGKVHKDCAIRCILGGIPPVLHVQNEKGESNYYLLVGPNGEKMNEAVKDFVAEPVKIKARAEQFDDWIILYVQDIQRLR
jgi:hypothetical protein